MLIVFEGADGCGKSTQIKLCRDWMIERGIDVVVCRDPGSTPLGERVRDLLLNHDSCDIGHRAEMLLFMTARAQLVEEIIRPNLTAGKIVLCDRFYLSTVVYQGYAGEIPISEIYQIAEIATNALKPELTLIFDLDVNTALQRVGAQRDRLESRGPAYFEKVREGFLAEAKNNPGQTLVLDARPAAAEVHAQVKHKIAEILGR
ncbi:MAG TPA: dTMP kinase [Pirellulaceae bacterium]|nr:dTMP kinase [Pirellulaceae bacterium]HMO93212.1 dTMP kinase [Pirellulaceae bacterium]HMP70043.1 dTMP kinase [Pirellulaceae bacterium]